MGGAASRHPCRVDVFDPARLGELLGAHLRTWDVLADDERARVLVVASAFGRRVRWQAARGLALDDEIRAVIAGQAGVLGMGLAADAFDGIGTVLVRQRPFVDRRPRPGPVVGTMTDGPRHIAGQMAAGQPVVVSWSDARRAARSPRRGSDVVAHELAHHLDLADGLLDGTPPLADASVTRRWVEVCTPIYEALRAGERDAVLRRYAATNPAEFFAVAVEAFLGRGPELEAAHPELYALLAAYLVQDPAARWEGAPRRWP